MEYINCIKKYGELTGRSTRREYWIFFLINIIASLFFSLIDYVIASLIEGDYFPIFRTLYALFILFPSLAVAVRRLHDIGKSGETLFIWFLPLVGGIWILVLLATKGDHFENKYGPSPYEPVLENPTEPSIS